MTPEPEAFWPGEDQVRAAAGSAGIPSVTPEGRRSTPEMVRDLARCLHVAEAERAATLRDVREALGLREDLGPELALEVMREIARDASALRQIRHHAKALRSVSQVVDANLAELLPNVPLDRR